MFVEGFFLFLAMSTWFEKSLAISILCRKLDSYLLPYDFGFASVQIHFIDNYTACQIIM